MKSIIKLLFFAACIGLIASCEKDEMIPDQNDPILKKAVKLMVQPCSSADVLTKAETDWQNISEALQNAEPGTTVQLAAGTFYLHKSVVCWDFNGILKGAGMGKTIIRTAPGMVFDRTDSPPINWKLESNDGGFMFCFPHQYNTEIRTVTVSDLAIQVDEPCTPYLRWKGEAKEMEFNSLQAINVHYVNLDNDMENPINLNVCYKNIAIMGDKDEKYNYNNFSVFYGLAAFGYSSGTFEAKNVMVENASGCIAPSAFYHENALVTVKNSHLKSCQFGVFSFLNHSWTILDNEIKDAWRPVVLLKRNAWGVSVDGPDGHSIIKNNSIQFTGDLGMGIQFVSNVEVKNNSIQGSGMYGGIACIVGNNWVIKDNDLCEVTAPTILLNNVRNSEIKNNFNQVIFGPSATEPTNIIGEGYECNE
ncbi:right-handed parallel beta-helix repeat-containing protein [uncultured Draconibacterium sp.]|uniref:right-handed parallel beta-helix repeat-containing protein n=1 Tax=uncultured Draconibacterium sp. TaxID=1573823 RepID=UPI0025FD44FD|nr:right-handed parallel beta-helix repeat-containing protein [uncultured Draconibacterium sp.]